MKGYKKLESGTYVVAVSGGVDSVVLLDLLCKQPDLQLIVAHVDHGIRFDSAIDSQFVKMKASENSLLFETKSVSLGVDASEEQARDVRYAFLRELQSKHNARQIVTAHHSDDVIETIIINLIRGTGWRGLGSLRDTEDIARPLLEIAKKDIIKYAQDHNLQWIEDSTNLDLKYQRNHIRHKIATKLNGTQRQSFLDLYRSQLKLIQDIDKHTKSLTSSRRHDYIMWPSSVSLEVLRSQLQLTRPQARRVLMAIKTARPGTKLEITKEKTLIFTDKTVSSVLK